MNRSETAREIAKCVTAAQAGDSAAFARLIELTQIRLFRFCFVLCGDKALAEDFCQDAYLKAFDSIGSLKNPETFIDWLFRIAKNIFIDTYRSKLRHEAGLDQRYIDETAAPAGHAEALDIHRALAQIEPEDRVLLLLVDLEERTYQEAAELLGITEAAVRSRVFRIRKIFVETWKKNETNRRSGSSSG